MSPTTDVLQEYEASRIAGLEVMDNEADAAAQTELLIALLPPPDQGPGLRRNCELAGRGQAHLMDAATFTFEEWEQVTRESIVHCWVKSTILPASMNASVVHSEYRQEIATVEEDVDEVRSLLRGTSLGREVVGGESEHDAREGMRAWLTAEDEEEAIVDTADLIVFPPDEAAADEYEPSGDEK